MLGWTVQQMSRFVDLCTMLALMWSVNEPRGHTHYPESMSPPLESARRVTLDFLTHQSSPGDLIDVSVNS